MKQATKFDNDHVNHSSATNNNSITDMLKSNSSKNPILQRLSYKLNTELDSDNVIPTSVYSRMHHRHNRS